MFATEETMGLLFRWNIQWQTIFDVLFFLIKANKKCVEPLKKIRTQKIKHFYLFFIRFYPLLYCFAWSLCTRWERYLVLETQHEQTVFVRMKLFLFFFSEHHGSGKQAKQTNANRKKKNRRTSETTAAAAVSGDQKQGRAAAAKQRRRTTKPRQATAPPLFKLFHPVYPLLKHLSPK